MSESALHLKLDRIITGQAQILARITEQDETTAILTAAITTLNDSIGTQTEVIDRLAEPDPGVRVNLGVLGLGFGLSWRYGLGRHLTHLALFLRTFLLSCSLSLSRIGGFSMGGLVC